MKVLFCSRRFFPAISGMSVYAANFLRELVRLGHEVTLVSQYRADADGTRIYGGGPPPAVPGVTVIGRASLGEVSGDFERDIDDLVATIVDAHRRAPFDILHAQYGYPNGWAALLAARVLRVPVVVSIQGGDGHWVGSCCETHRVAMRRVIQGADAVVIGGDSFAAEVAARLDVPRDAFTIVPGAVDTGRFRPAAAAAPASVRRLLYHGRVDARKGVIDFLDALAVLAARGTPFAATISGIGPDLARAEAHAAARGLAVRFTGYAAYEAAPALYRDADIFVSPSYAEGFSNTVLEAMASGLPIVSCDTVGIADCLRDGENALLVRPGDVAALADAIGKLIGDARLRTRLGGAALAECRATYAWPHVASRIVALYDTLAGRAPKPPVDPVLPVSACRFRAQAHLL